MHVEVQRCQLVRKELDNAFMSSLIGREKAAGILSSNHKPDFGDTSSRGNMIGNRTGAFGATYIRGYVWPKDGRVGG